MNMNKINITLDVNLNKITSVVLKQYNKDSQWLIVNITENGRPFYFDETDICIFKMKTPDGREIYNESVITGDTVLVEITQNCCANSGTGEAELNIINEKRTSQIATMNFKIVIEESVFHDDDIVGSSEFGALVNRIAEADQAIENANKATNDLQSKLDSHHFVLTEDKGVVNGVSGLDENAKVPDDELYEATTSTKGITQLTDSVTSTSISTAATPNSVKQAYDSAATVSKNLETEKNRAIETENNLDTRITTETSRATAAEENILDLAKMKVDKVNGKDLSSNDYTDTEKNKLAGIAEHAEVNQNTFSNVMIGNTTITADTKTDTLTLTAGSNVTITPDEENGAITISSTDTKYTHPDTSGNKHIPRGGSSGQILKWASDGTAVWGDEGDPDIVVTGVKGNTESSYRKGNVNITAEDIGALPVNGNAVSATKATQDGKGNVIPDTYAKKSIYDDNAVSVGRKTDTTVGTNSFAFGSSVEASGDYSHAEGSNTIASGAYSHAEGYGTKATAGYNAGYSGCSHAEGYGTTASAPSSHAEGINTQASANASHSEGYYTNANGFYSHTEGSYTKASGYASHAQGKYNKEMQASPSLSAQYGDAFVIGNGTSTSALSNAFRVNFAGNVYGVGALIPPVPTTQNLSSPGLIITKKTRTE